jgi:prepilin-type N-terminal cleavage/methylation domain-containing protein
MRILKMFESLKSVKKRAFTLAEILIVMGIIGLVAAFTLPLLKDVSGSRTWDIQSQDFEAKFYAVLKQMNTKSQLARLDSTEEFVENLQKNMKILNVCTKDELEKCFSKKVSLYDSVKNKPAKPQKLTDLELTSSANFGFADWETNIMGIQFTNGVQALLAYNANDCAPTTNDYSDLYNCVAMIYDVNGNGDPNVVYKASYDIRHFHVSKFGGTYTDCIASGLCIAIAIPSSEGVDCTRLGNSATCQDYTPGTNYAQIAASNHTGSNRNRVVDAGIKCKEMDMKLATLDQVKTLVNGLGKQYMSELAEKYNTRTFASSSYSASTQQVQGYNITTNTFSGIGHVDKITAAVCVANK